VQAVAILRHVEPFSGIGRYVFPSPRTCARPLCDNALTVALRRLGYTGTQMIWQGFAAMVAPSTEGSKCFAMRRYRRVVMSSSSGATGCGRPRDRISGVWIHSDANQGRAVFCLWE
jgi:hypothetical protein